MSRGEAGEPTAKKHMTAIIQDLPDDTGYDEILRELAFHRMIVRGLACAHDGRTLDDQSLRERIRAWPG